MKRKKYSLKDKYFEKIFRIAKRKKRAHIQKSYDYFNNFFIAFTVALILLILDLIKKLKETSLLDFIILGVLIFINFLFLFFRNIFYIALVLREEGKHKSREDAFKLFNEI